MVEHIDNFCPLQCVACPLKTSGGCAETCTGFLLRKNVQSHVTNTTNLFSTITNLVTEIAIIKKNNIENKNEITNLKKVNKALQTKLNDCETVNSKNKNFLENFDQKIKIFEFLNNLHSNAAINLTTQEIEILKKWITKCYFFKDFNALNVLYIEILQAIENTKKIEEDLLSSNIKNTNNKEPILMNNSTINESKQLKTFHILFEPIFAIAVSSSPTKKLEKSRAFAYFSIKKNITSEIQVNISLKHTADSEFIETYIYLYNYEEDSEINFNLFRFGNGLPYRSRINKNWSDHVRF